MFIIGSNMKHTHPKLYNLKSDIIPPDAVYIGRGSRSELDTSRSWGNPFRIGIDGTRKEVIRKYKEMVESDEEFIQLIRKELKGKDLVCFCSPKKCHGEILLKIANSNRLFL